MNENSNVFSLRQPGNIDDPPDGYWRKQSSWRRRPFSRRHGHGPERAIQTGIGPVERVKIRDRGAASEGERIRFTSAILPLWGLYKVHGTTD